MDLGIAGRKAIVCASSRGLGRACAKALIERLPVHMHSAILDAVVAGGGAAMIVNAFAR